MYRWVFPVQSWIWNAQKDTNNSADYASPNDTGLTSVRRDDMNTENSYPESFERDNYTSPTLSTRTAVKIPWNERNDTEAIKSRAFNTYSSIPFTVKIPYHHCTRQTQRNS